MGFEARVVVTKHPGRGAGGVTAPAVHSRRRRNTSSAGDGEIEVASLLLVAPDEVGFPENLAVELFREEMKLVRTMGRMGK